MKLFSEFLLEMAIRASGYSDEHAFKEVWNYAIKNNIITDKNALHQEIDNAKYDQSHPLNFHNLPIEGFQSKDRQFSSPEFVYSELHNAANTVHDVANHSDFIPDVQHQTLVSITGQNKSKLSNTWLKYGVRNTTPKADLLLGDKRISYKKHGKSQLMSAEPAEALATYDHVTAKMLSDKKISITDRHNILKHIKRAVDSLQEMKTTIDPENRSILKTAAQYHLNTAHQIHPELNHYLHHEAASGIGKFVDKNDTVSHVIFSYNDKKKHALIKSVNTYLNNIYSINLPRAATPKKTTGSPGNIKIDIRH